METFSIDWGLPCLLTSTSREFETVLDIGSGAGEHSRFLRYQGKDVKSVDFDKDADFFGDFMEIDFDQKFDLIWASHVLEHQRNVGAFLEKTYSLLSDDGYLAVTVPSHAPTKMLAGHLTVWSAYLLIYNLILAGFDCSEASVYSEHEISVLVQKRPAITRFKNSAIGDEGDEYLTVRHYFPFEVRQGGIQNDRFTIRWHKPNLSKPVKIESRFLAEPLIIE